MWEIIITQTFLVMLILIQFCKPIIIRSEFQETRRALNYSAEDKPRIMGSNHASLYEYTFMAILVQYENLKRITTGKGQLICGGAIIHKDWVLTAARCFNQSINKLDLRKFEVYAGVVDLNSEVGQQTRQIQKILIHPKYDSLSDEFNLAMIHVSPSFTITTYVQAGHLPVSPLSITGIERCHILGFIREYTTAIDELMNEPFEDRLIKVQLHAIDYKECLDRLKVLKTRQAYRITDKNYGLVQIEDYPHNNSQGACEGDAGGPCVCDFKIQGVIAHHTNQTCYNVGYPTTIVDVGHHLNWIRANILQLNMISTNLGVQITNTNYLLKIYYFVVLLLNIKYYCKIYFKQ